MIYDWIIIGAGITGSALAYELSKQNCKILLLEKDLPPDNATVYSYGGIAYWSGTNDLTRQLAQEGIELYRQLGDELATDIEFSELDLLLTVKPEDNPTIIAQNFQKFAIQPEILDNQEACQIEPLLNQNAIAGSLKLPHAKVNAQKTASAYQQAFQRNQGIIKYEKVIDLVRQQNTIQGVITPQNTYYAANTIVCAGGLTNSLLKTAGITTKTYFTHAQVIKTQPVSDLKLNTIVMPAIQQRFTLEATAKTLEETSAWKHPNNNVVQSILDPGAVQICDRSFYLGQISAIVTNPHYTLNAPNAEQQIRQAIASILPSLANIPGTCHHCLVAFNGENIALVGHLKNFKGIYLFTGFTSTILYAPPLARHFANWLLSGGNPIIKQLI